MNGNRPSAVPDWNLIGSHIREEGGGVSGGHAVIGIRSLHNGATADTGAFSVVKVREQNVQFLHTDHLGSPVAATGSAGVVVGTQSFYPFGEVRTGTGIFDTERGFTGQIRDTSTGLNFYNARYQDPVLGRFISPDSIVPNPANPAHFNRFAYVQNRPLVFIDPSGRDDCSFAGENDSCQTVSEGSNASVGIITAYALDRIYVEDEDLFDYNTKLAVLSGDDEVSQSDIWIASLIFNDQDERVADLQSTLEGVAHPIDDPIDPDLWWIQSEFDSRFDGAGSLRRPSNDNNLNANQALGVAEVVGGSGLAAWGVTQVIVGTVALPYSGGSSALLILSGAGKIYNAVAIIADGVCRGTGRCIDVPYVPLP